MLPEIACQCLVDPSRIVLFEYGLGCQKASAAVDLRMQRIGILGYLKGFKNEKDYLQETDHTGRPGS